jgi:hypothetical protein
VLNKYVKPDFDLKANKGYITLTTHNAKADTMNSQALHDLKGELITTNRILWATSLKNISDRRKFKT